MVEVWFETFDWADDGDRRCSVQFRLAGILGWGGIVAPSGTD